MPDRSELAEILQYQRERLHRWWHLRPQPAAADRAIRAKAALDTADAGKARSPGAADTLALTRDITYYLWLAQRRALAAGGTLAYYPGAPSIYGARNDGIEGVTRLLPLWAAAVESGQFAGDADAAMRQHLLSAVRSGTQPGSPAYWGAIEDRSTLICEAADVALGVWLARSWLWPRLEAPDRQALVDWLGQAIGKRCADNNWHLFIVLIDAVRSALMPSLVFSSQQRLDRVMSFARGDGCFVDGPQGEVDLYNAWAFHYGLYWLQQIRPDLAPAGLHAQREAFCRWFRWLFTRSGVPLFGRSLCYRMAVSAPLLAAALSGSTVVSAAEAVTAYDTSLRHFVREGGLAAGRPTQGVLGDDLRWLDPYSGPASSLWGTRAMVLMLHGAERLGACGPHVALPAETEAAELHVPALGATVVTRPEQAESMLVFDALAAAAGTPAADPRCPHPIVSLRDRLRTLVYARASRQTCDLRNLGRRHFSSHLTEYR